MSCVCHAMLLQISLSCWKSAYRQQVNVSAYLHAADMLMRPEVIYADVPTIGTRLWTSKLGRQLGLVADWRPWYLAIPESFGLQVSPPVAHLKVRFSSSAHV